MFVHATIYIYIYIYIYNTMHACRMSPDFSSIYTCYNMAHGELKLALLFGHDFGQLKSCLYHHLFLQIHFDRLWHCNLQTNKILCMHMCGYVITTMDPSINGDVDVYSYIDEKAYALQYIGA
jgi:hypothetical protein